MQAYAPATVVAARLDRLPVTWLHVIIVGVCGVGFFFDLFEVVLGNALSVVFSTPPHVATARELSLLLSSLYVGAAVGAPVCGFLADRYGRKTVLTALLFWLTFSSICAAASSGIATLTVFRGLTGVAIGAYWPLVVAYLTDILPPRRRGTLIFAMVAVGTLGSVGGISVLRWLTIMQPFGFEGWRCALLLGGIGSCVAAVVFLFLPESARWLEARGDSAFAEKACTRFERSLGILRGRFASSAQAALPVARIGEPGPVTSGRRQVAIFGMLFALSPWSTVAFPLMTGVVLVQRGYGLKDVLLYMTFSFLGPFVGVMSASTIVDAIGRRAAMVVSALVMIASGYAFCVTPERSLLVAAGFAYTFFCVVYVTTLNIYSSEIFSTRARASSLSLAWSLNRIGAAVAPATLLPILHRSGPVTMFLLIALTLVVSTILLCVAPRSRSCEPVR
ncbi:MFS transporter [Paraburkholderia sediminicola]|uniref:MFS transporter n=1 Tax=Paraburkholderia sediminicola TaxID=458836 RepID=UPI0038BD6B7A